MHSVFTLFLLSTQMHNQICFQKNMSDRLVQLQVLFTNYELSFITQHLQCWIMKVKRHHPNLLIDCPTLQKNHKVLQFTSTTGLQIPAYDLYKLKIRMIQSFLPQPRIYFTDFICNAARTFPNCNKQDHHSFQPQYAEDPLLPLILETGLSIYHLQSRKKTCKLLLYTPSV